MPRGSRKRYRSEDRSCELGNDVAKVNKNSNHSAESAQSYKSKPRKVKSKIVVVNNDEVIDQEVTEPPTAQFNEDQDYLEMHVQGDLTSDGEVDSDSENESEDEIQNPIADEEREPEPMEQGEGDEMRHNDRETRQKERRDRRVSLEQKLDTLSTSVQVMQQMIAQQGLVSQQLPLNRPTTSKNSANTYSESDTTIYRTAAQKQGSADESIHIPVQGDPEISFKNNKRASSSSEEEQVDTSDELIDYDEHDKFIAECTAQAKKQNVLPNPAVQESQNVIRESEANKADLYATPGNCANVINWMGEGNFPPDMRAHAFMADEQYLVIGAHLDGQTRQKIVSGEYVDFAQLLPKNKLATSGLDDHRMELVSRGGQTFFVPISDREASVISSLGKWEQAFRIYSNVYTKAHPHRASELIQYNHVIFTAANSFVWDNVYTYDKEFRMHMASFPHCNWSIILQQAWSMCLKDKINCDDNGRVQSPVGSFVTTSHNTSKFQKSNENCKRFNKGKCPNGPSCKYQHRCDECGKFGHGIHICHKRKQNNSTNSSQPSK